jgi:hypothetical protein
LHGSQRRKARMGERVCHCSVHTSTESGTISALVTALTAVSSKRPPPPRLTGQQPRRLRRHG